MLAESIEAAAASERRELNRLRYLAAQARLAVETLDGALLKACDAADVQTAASHIRGTATTFARAALALVTLA
jgi:hypothetical protein